MDLRSNKIRYTGGYLPVLSIQRISKSPHPNSNRATGPKFTQILGIGRCNGADLFNRWRKSLWKLFRDNTSSRLKWPIHCSSAITADKSKRHWWIQKRSGASTALHGTKICQKPGIPNSLPCIYEQIPTAKSHETGNWWTIESFIELFATLVRVERI